MEDNKKHRPMTAGELIEALSKLDKDKPVLINVKQYNKFFGVVQLPIVANLNFEDLHSRFSWVDASYNGATITVHLPYGAFISKLPKD